MSVTTPLAKSLSLVADTVAIVEIDRYSFRKAPILWRMFVPRSERTMTSGYAVIAEPIRTNVAPSSIAISKSCVIPIESSVN